MQVRAELAAFLERRSALDAACHEVLAAQERDRGQQLTDAHVDARIRWVLVLGRVLVTAAGVAMRSCVRRRPAARPSAGRPAGDANGQHSPRAPHPSPGPTLPYRPRPPSPPLPPPSLSFATRSAVWQVVTGVADAIRLLHDRYAPDARSREAERHIRCTGEGWEAGASERRAGTGAWMGA